MTVADLIAAHGIENVSSAIIRDVGGDRHTGCCSSWAPAASLRIESEDAAAEIVRELPGMIFIASDDSVWMVSK